MVKVKSINILAISDREMDNSKNKLKKYFGSIGPGDGQW